jgi:4a-hydroxytetrahydrobiopterin dehydratase
MSDKLDAAALDEALVALPHWSHDASRGALTREFRFADFAQAFAFMTEVARLAEAFDHHPEWFNVYARVCVTWTSHDVGGLSQRDLQLARLTEAVAARLAGPDAQA